jgi:CRISPR-associated protein Cas6
MPGAMVDVAFPLSGTGLPRDHRHPLAQALERALPDLAGWAGAGIHPVKVAAGAADAALLPARARLLLRVPRRCAVALGTLAGRELAVAGHRLRLGDPSPRELLAHGTLYAEFVLSESDDEAAFMSAVDAQLRDMGVQCRRVCGRRRLADGGGRELQGFSLMLYELSPADSLRVLDAGLGDGRRLGFGLFVPHRSAAAVAA